MAVAAASVLIPDGLNDSHFVKIEGFLKDFLRELQDAGTDAQRVTSRLNYSNTDNITPCWAGTVEHSAIATLQRFDAGRVRFGQSNRSKVYEEAVLAPQGHIIDRDWGQDLPEKSQGGYGPGQALGPRAGCRYQLFIALRTPEGRRFGTLTVGFKYPPDRKRVDPIMQEWTTEKRPYVPYIRDTFALGGPTR